MVYPGDRPLDNRIILGGLLVATLVGGKRTSSDQFLLLFYGHCSALFSGNFDKKNLLALWNHGFIYLHSDSFNSALELN